MAEPTPYKIIDYKPQITDNTETENLYLLIAITVVTFLFLICLLTLVIKCRNRCSKKHNVYVEKPDTTRVEKRWNSKHDALFDNEKLRLPNYADLPLSYQQSIS